MRRTVAMVLAACCLWVFTGLVEGAPGSTSLEKEVLQVGHTAAGDVQMVVWKSVQGKIEGRQFLVPGGRTIEYGEARQVYSFLWDQRYRTSTSTGHEVPKLSGGFFSLIGAGAGNIPLLIQGMRDIKAAMGGHFSAGTSMENLRDPVKRYEFWKNAGIFDRYTGREIAFLNSVVFPLVAVEGVLELALGAALVGSGAATRLGPWGGFIVAALVLGGAGAELFGMMSDIENGRPVEPSRITQLLTNGVAVAASAGATGAGAGTSGMVWATAKLAGVSMPAVTGLVRVLAGVPGALMGTQLALDSAVFMGRLMNV